MIINSPLNWQIHYDYARSGLGQDATTTTDPFANIMAGVSTGTSGWGVGEYAVIIIGGFALLSMFLTTRRGVSKVRKTVRRRRARRQKQIKSYYGI